MKKQISKYRKFLFFFFALAFFSCAENYSEVEDDASNNASTSPSLALEVNSTYLSANGVQSKNQEEAIQQYSQSVETFNEIGEILTGQKSVDSSTIPDWDSATTYSSPGSKVKYTSPDGKSGIFINSWWTKNNEPSFVPNYGPWKMVKRLDTPSSSTSGSTAASAPDAGVDEWSAKGVYTGGYIVKKSIAGNFVCFEAKWWTQGNEPPDTDPVNAWETPWKRLVDCSGKTSQSNPPDIGKVIGKIPPPSTDPVTNPEPPPSVVTTPIVPPVVPAPVKNPTPTVQPAPVAVSSTGKAQLPADGYEFLRLVTEADWDWLFPLRTGKYNQNGGTRNREPIANPNGSTDIFTLDAFKHAVLDYNSWAQANNFKQFLNEGTRRQQAQEFLAFWAKSSRETSGSWAGANAPWAINYTTKSGENIKIWKGALYWVEEIGHSTRPDGTSPYVAYSDSASSYRPAAGRSYYGRGIIQLSWNYNYGPFSEWVYNAGLLRDLITEPYTLLRRPDYIANKGRLSILSGIWFWMTPQGAKPSSHDVMFGDVYNVSQTSQEQGLPQRRDGRPVPAAKGITNDPSVFAYRIGTVINIVNGGLECNGAAKWHYGPGQRVSYYNGYASYFNDKISGLNAMTIPGTSDLWEKHVNDSDSEIVKNATCYTQKMYYGW